MKKRKGTWDFDDVIIIVILAMIIFIILSLSFANTMEANMASIIGGILSAIATVFVGVIGIWQNKRYKKMADEANDVHIRPEFFVTNQGSSLSKHIGMPSVYVYPVKGQQSQELLCFCKVLDLPILRIRPKSLIYLDDNQIIDEYYEFRLQYEIDHIYQNGEEFRIFLPRYNTSYRVELELKYENIYGNTYSKKLTYEPPKKFVVPGGPISGKYASDRVKLDPARRECE